MAIDEITDKNGDKAQLLGSLLRAELSAAKTYLHVLEKAPAGKGIEQLKRIEQEHRESVRLLSAQLAELGEKPSEDGSTWDTIAIVAEMAGDPLADPMAIKALKEGEEQGIMGYQNALESGRLPEELRQLIGDMLLPRASAHLPVLDKLLEAA